MDEEKEEVSVEQTIKDREFSMEHTKETIRWLGIEIEFKENQLDSKIVEENVSELYKLVSFPLNHEKPRHVLKIEIEMLKKGVKTKRESLDIMKKLQAEDEKKLEENNAAKSN